ncbi:MAG: 2Fe-2S iron-sulfur cluster binding domain-containing protein, partial [Myxococcota bacterium]
MAEIQFGATRCTLNSNETVLDALQRNGITIPSSCRAGICQSCLVQARSGEVPAAAQVGLKDTWKSRGYFLAC